MDEVKRKPICIYHSADLDGKCSAAIVYYALKGEVELFGWNYGHDIPWYHFEDMDVIMVDVSFQPFSEMLRLREMVKSLTWIDHHESALAEADAHHWEISVPGLRRIGVGACELVWEHCMASRLLTDPLPYAVRLLSLYDVWDHEISDVLPFQYGMRLRDVAPDSDEWLLLFHNGPFACGDYTQRVIDNGRVILAYQKQQNAAMIKARGFETTLDGLRCIACNAGLVNSQLFDTVWDPEKYDAMLAFQWTPKGYWTVSLYSPKPDVDLASLCKSRGGGGHKGAAGFQCDELPFALKP